MGSRVWGACPHTGDVHSWARTIGLVICDEDTGSGMRCPTLSMAAPSPANGGSKQDQAPAAGTDPARPVSPGRRGPDGLVVAGCSSSRSSGAADEHQRRPRSSPSSTPTDSSASGVDGVRLGQLRQVTDGAAGSARPTRATSRICSCTTRGLTPSDRWRLPTAARSPTCSARSSLPGAMLCRSPPEVAVTAMPDTPPRPAWSSTSPLWPRSPPAPAPPRSASGARLIDVYTPLNNSGVSIPAGSCPTVGIAGLTLGGGVGVVDRAYGLTCDAMSSVVVVTADSRVVTADATTNSDLYWACRGGGGGNFGIATSFTYRTFPTSPLTLVFLTWPWAAAADVVPAWLSWAPSAPDQLWSNLLLMADPAGGSPKLQVGVVWMGPASGVEAPARPPVRRGGFAALRTSDRDRTLWPRHVRRRRMRVVQPGRLSSTVSGAGRSPVPPAQPGQVRLFPRSAGRRRGRRLDFRDRRPAIGWRAGGGRDRRLRRRYQSGRSRGDGLRAPFGPGVGPVQRPI